MYTILALAALMAISLAAPAKQARQISSFVQIEVTDDVFGQTRVDGVTAGDKPTSLDTLFDGFLDFPPTRMALSDDAKNIDCPVILVPINEDGTVGKARLIGNLNERTPSIDLPKADPNELFVSCEKQRAVKKARQAPTIPPTPPAPIEVRFRLQNDAGRLEFNSMAVGDKPVNLNKMFSDDFENPSILKLVAYDNGTFPILGTGARCPVVDYDTSLGIVKKLVGTLSEKKPFIDLVEAGTTSFVGKNVFIRCEEGPTDSLRARTISSLKL